MKVMVTGASGQVGQALLAQVPAGVSTSAFTHAELDIADPAAVAAAVAREQPDVVINAAAYTAVDQAERDPQQAERVNATAPRVLAEALSDRGFLLHVSTDFVFDGRKAAPYHPEDPTAPLSVYGRSKRDGEAAVRQVLPARSAIVRTAWVYAPRGKNFLLTMLRLMRERGAVRVVNDQTGTPTTAASVARVLWRLAQRPEAGVFHWTDGGVATWYDFAVAIAEEAFAAGLLAARPSVTPIPASEYPTPAQRPAYSVLDCATTVAATGLAPIPWRQALRGVIEEIARA